MLEVGEVGAHNVGEAAVGEGVSGEGARNSIIVLQSYISHRSSTQASASAMQVSAVFKLA